MSQVGFGFMPSIVFLIMLMGIAVLTAVGAAALVRGRDSLLRAIGVGALTVAGLVLLALTASLFLVAPFSTYLFLTFLLVGALGLAVWVAALVDCAINEPSQGNDKIVWVVIIVFTQLLGAVLYLLLRRPRRMAETGQ